MAGQPPMLSKQDRAIRVALDRTETPMTFGELCRQLNRSPVYVRRLQSRFELPVREEAGYTPAYLAFLRTIIFLRILGVSEERIQELWRLERKLLQLLHADASGSPTWFLDACGVNTHSGRRLLLSNYDLGVHLPSGALQLGLNFAERPAELWTGRDMGEDELRLLKEYLQQLGSLRASIRTELPVTLAAARWGKRQAGK